MTLADLVSTLSRLNQNEHQYPETKVFVGVFQPGKIGGSPCEEVTSVDVGFDWDAGKILLNTARPLTALNPEDVLAIKQSAKEGQSWHAFQSYKKQAEKIKALEAKIKELESSNPNNHGQ